MIFKWINNIVDYKCKVYCFFFQNATNPSFFFMLVYVIKKDISSGSRTRVSGAGGGRSNKEHQRLQGLECLFLRSGEWGLHTAFTGIHICYIDIPQWVLTRHLRFLQNVKNVTFFVIFFVQSAFSTPRCRSHWLIQAIKSVWRLSTNKRFKASSCWIASNKFWLIERIYRI